jgi:hypothetical protein
MLVSLVQPRCGRFLIKSGGRLAQQVTPPIAEGAAHQKINLNLLTSLCPVQLMVGETRVRS